MIRYLLCLLLLISFKTDYGQILPESNDTLYQTHMLFEIPANQKATYYEIQIATSRDQFERSIVSTRGDSIPQIVVADGLEFGRTYYWRQRHIGNSKVLYTSRVDSFHIRASSLTNSLLFRNTVDIDKARSASDGYIVLDNGVIINRRGETIWHMPRLPENNSIRNLQLNSDGNLTFTDSKNCFEIELKGRILWQSPSKVGNYEIGYYHHDIQKTKEGHFVCLATKKPEPNKRVYNIVFAVNRENELQWLWDEEPLYIGDSTFKGAHINSIFLDSAGRYLYLSSRDISTIQKIDLAAGKMVYSIGRQYRDVPNYRNDFFSGQHSLSVSSSGNLLFFNNNTRHLKRDGSSLILLTQPSDTHPPTILREYVFNFGNEEENFSAKVGDVQLLPNGNMLVFAGNNGKTFEVNEQDEIIWQNTSEQYDTTNRVFVPINGYRADHTISLFPCRFYAAPGATKQELTIQNTGIVEDYYTYSVIRKDSEIKKFRTISLLPGQRLTETVPAKAEKAIITSGRNPYLSRTISFNKL